MEQMPESKCMKCGKVHAWSKLVLNLTYLCQYCGYLNKYSRLNTEPDKINPDNIIPNTYEGPYASKVHTQYSLRYPFIPKSTSLFGSIMKQKLKGGYKFKATCEHSVDLYKIAEDLDEKNYCFHVITEGTNDPVVNAFLVHRSIFQKALTLNIPCPEELVSELHYSFGIFHLEQINKKNRNKVDYTQLKKLMKWVNDVHNASYADVFPTKINNKPIMIRVTNCSKESK